MNRAQIESQHICGDRLKNNTELVFDHTRNPSIDKIAQKVNRIWCKADFCLYLFDLLRDRKKPLLIVTHNSDIEINHKIFYKKPDCLKVWYAQNANITENGIIGIPIGVENRKSPFGYSGDITVISTKAGKAKNNLLFVNFNKKTNEAERGYLERKFSSGNWCDYANYGISFNECMERIAVSDFVICPRGNGIDTHRVWEALYLGAIPIVRKELMWEHFSDLPIMIVNSWDEVTRDRLIEERGKIRARKCNLDKLTMKYWLGRIMKWRP